MTIFISFSCNLYDAIWSENDDVQLIPGGVDILSRLTGKLHEKNIKFLGMYLIDDYAWEAGYLWEGLWLRVNIQHAGYSYWILDIRESRALPRLIGKTSFRNKLRKFSNLIKEVLELSSLAEDVVIDENELSSLENRKFYSQDVGEI